MIEFLIIFSPKILFIAQGVITTLEYSILSVIFGLIIGVILAICKTSKHRVFIIFADIYTSIFRGTPLLIQLMIIYYGLPSIGFKLTVFSAGVIAFSMNSGAYLSEIIRSGINSVDLGQFEAAKTLGISPFYSMRDIILPQAIRKILPSLINELINLLKESAIISVLGEMDLMRRAQMVASESFMFFAPFLTAAACYYMLVLFFTYLAGLLEKRLQI